MQIDKNYQKFGLYGREEVIREDERKFGSVERNEDTM